MATYTYHINFLKNNHWNILGNIEDGPQTPNVADLPKQVTHTPISEMTVISQVDRHQKTITHTNLGYNNTVLDTVKQNFRDMISSHRFGMFPLYIDHKESMNLDETIKCLNEVIDEFSHVENIREKIIFVHSNMNYTRTNLYYKGIIMLPNMYNTMDVMKDGLYEINHRKIDDQIPAQNPQKIFVALFWRSTYDRLQIFDHLQFHHDDVSDLKFHQCRHDLFFDHRELHNKTYDKKKYLLDTMNQKTDQYFHNPSPTTYKARRNAYHKFVHNDLRKRMDKAFVNVVSETNFYEHNIFYITEKLFNPLTMGLPFVVSSTYKYYNFLHYLGFKTFKDFWPEDFDDIKDHLNRAQRFNEVLDHIANTYDTVGKRKNALQKMQPILKHNRKLMFMYFNFPPRFVEKINLPHDAIVQYEQLLLKNYPQHFKNSKLRGPTTKEFFWKP